jgi:hypothetical protein
MGMGIYRFIAAGCHIESYLGVDIFAYISRDCTIFFPESQLIIKRLETSRMSKLWTGDGGGVKL